MLGWLRNRFRRGPVVPVVRLSGVIASSGLLGARGLSIEGVAPLLARAFGQRGAKAVAIAINSPGGSPVQSALIAQRIRLLAGEIDLSGIRTRPSTPTSRQGRCWMMRLMGRLHESEERDRNGTGNSLP